MRKLLFLFVLFSSEKIPCEEHSQGICIRKDYSHRPLDFMSAM